MGDSLHSRFGRFRTWFMCIIVNQAKADFDCFFDQYNCRRGYFLFFFFFLGRWGTYERIFSSLPPVEPMISPRVQNVWPRKSLGWTKNRERRGRERREESIRIKFRFPRGFWAIAGEKKISCNYEIMSNEFLEAAVVGEWRQGWEKDSGVVREVIPRYWLVKVRWGDFKSSMPWDETQKNSEVTLKTGFRWAEKQL